MWMFRDVWLCRQCLAVSVSVVSDVSALSAVLCYVSCVGWMLLYLAVSAVSGWVWLCRLRLALLGMSAVSS